MPDDYEASLLTSGSVAVGATTTGDIETVGDQDWFAVTLVEGREYSIEISGLYSPGSGTLSDPYLRGVHNGSGFLLFPSESDDADIAERLANTTIVAGYSGTHFIAASGYGTATGTYTVSVTDLGVPDDYGSDIFSSGQLDPGFSAFGTLEEPNDSDWFKTYLYAGVNYRFDLFGSGTGNWANADNLILESLRDETGAVIPMTGELFGNGTFSLSPLVRSTFEYTPQTTGYVYVDASSYEGSTGRYQLDVTDLGYTDDWTEGPIQPGLVFVGSSLMAEIEADGDVDWISVDLVEGESYEISLRGSDTGDGTLPYVNLAYMIDPFGSEIPYAFNSGASGGNSSLTFIAPDTGTYQIAVDSFEGFTGTYTVYLDNLFVFDDYADNPTTSGELLIDSSIPGIIDYSGDADFFRVFLTAGTIYQFDMTSFDSMDPYIDGIYSYAWNHFDNHPDNLIPGTINDDFGQSLNSRVTFTAPTTGDYFISATSFDSSTGDYDLSVITVGTVGDDYLGNNLSQEVLPIGGTVDGINEREQDEDWFRVTLDAGSTYRFSFFAEDTYLAAFDNPVIRVFNQFGALNNTTFVEYTNYNETSSLFSPTTSGIYYVAVGDDLSTNGTGPYQISAEFVGFTDDYASDPGTTGAFLDMGSPTTHVIGTIEEDGDSDWFAVDLVQGHRYDINLKGSETNVGTLFDPFFDGVYDSAGLFLGGADDDSGQGLNSYSSFVASYTGTHYFSASAAVSEGFNTGVYVLQYDDLGPDDGTSPLPTLINEGESYILEFTFEDFGISRDVAVDWEMTSLITSGTADAADFALLPFEDFDSLDIDLTAIDDSIVEDDESLIFEVTGFIDYVGPISGSGGSTFLNVDGNTVNGELNRFEFTRTYSYTINSAPEGDPTPIDDFVFAGPGVIGNTLTNFADGSGETFSVFNTSFSGAVSGQILANGDIVVLSSTGAPGESVNVPFVVIDSRGALTFSNQIITVGQEQDDFLPGDAASVFGSISVNTTELGVIETTGDRDRFDVLLQAGIAYQVLLEGSSTQAGTLLDPAITGVFDGQGRPVEQSSDNDSGTGTNARLDRLVVPFDGIYQIEVGSAFDSGTGDYALTVTQLNLTDDYLPGLLASDFGSVSLGSPATGQIDFDGDEDWFAAVLLSGRQYEIQLRGEPTLDGTLADPVLAGVHDLQGVFLGGFNDDADPTTRNSLSVYTADYSGVHYLAASGLLEDGQTAATYTLEIVDLGPTESNLVAEETVNEGNDLTLNIPYDLPVGITLPFPGTGSPGEFLLNNQIVVSFDVEGDLNGSDINLTYGLGGTHILVFDALDDALVEDDETITVDVSGYLDWIVPNEAGQTYTNLVGGSVVGFLERTFVDFSVAVTINSAPEGNPIPVSGYVFTGPETVTNVLTTFSDGEEERFSVIPFTFGDGTVSGELLANGDLVLNQSTALPGQSLILNFTVQDARGAVTQSQQVINIGTPPDDFLPGADATALGSVAVDGSATGNIETDGDRDRFVVALQAGAVYDISLAGASSGAGTLANPQVVGLFDALGAQVATGDDDSGFGTDALVSGISVTADGFFEIEVAGSGDVGTGDYTLSVVQIGVLDDYLPGTFADVFGTVDVGTPATGVLETDGDRDRFSVALQAGHIYDISLEGVTTGGGSLSDPTIVGVFNSLGAALAGGGNDNSGVGSNALVDGFTVAADGTYQIEVGSSGDLGAGDYTLSVNFVGYIDDFLPGISADFGLVTVGGQSTGEIETTGDVDGFRVFLQADTTYEIAIRGLDSGSGTLLDPSLSGVFSSSDLNGTPLASVQTLNTQIVGDDSVSYFTPQSAGDYFIGVEDEFGGLGTYTVQVSDIGTRDDYSADRNTTGTIAPGVPAAGRIDFAEDRDWFQVTLEAGRLYEIQLVPDAGANAISDPFFGGVYNSNGALIANTTNDDGGDGTSSALQFVTDESGQYYLSAGGFGGITGNYRLILNDQGVLDDDGFDITIEFASQNVSSDYIQAFEEAVDRWEEIITGDLSYAFVEGYGFVDDILIEVAVEDIELTFAGVEQTILAISSVLDQRTDSSSGSGALPTYSRIVINSGQVGALVNLDEFVANTIGRALGFGSLWEEFGLVVSIDGAATYVGANGLREMDRLSSSLNGVNALEDGANGGLAGEYWREAVFDSELMTSRVELRRPGAGQGNPNVPDNPISALTIAAMEDLGYQVNYAAADRYSLPNGAVSRQAPAARASDDLSGAEYSNVAKRLVSELPDNDSIPNGPAFIYARQNVLSEQPQAYALNGSNTELVDATGTNVVFLEGVTGENLLVELRGTFQKNDPANVTELSGTVDAMEVRSLSGLLLFTIDFTQRPASVSDVVAQWPNYSFDNDNILIVDTAIAGGLVRINPNDADAGANRILAGAGDDYVRGGSNSELINGGPDNDTLLGQDGSDSLVGESGNDLIDGGEGVDTSVYSGAQSAYTLTLSPGLTTLQDRRADGNGLDTLQNVEFLDFDSDVLGGPFDLRIFGGPTSLSAPDFESFIELYIAYFNRAPDAIGLNFWGTAFANGTTLVEMAALFGPQDETLAAYPQGTSNEVFATTVYNNVLGRTPDQGGIDFWVGQLDAGKVSRDQFILSVLQGAKSDLKPEFGEDFVAQQLADRDYLENKIDIGAYFAVHKGMSNVENARAAMALFDGTSDGISAAVAAIDGFHTAALGQSDGEFLMPLVGVLDDPFAMI